MKAQRIDEYHKGSANYYGKLVVVHYLDDAMQDPKYGAFSGAEISLDYLAKAKKLIRERYENFTVLQDVPDLVVRIE